MTRKFKENKKGEDMMVDFVAIAIFAFIIVIFGVLILFETSANENLATVDFHNKDASYMLNAFLKSPSPTIAGKNVADIIAEDNTDLDLTKAHFNYFFSGIKSYSGYEINKIIMHVSEDGSSDDTFCIINRAGSFELSDTEAFCEELYTISSDPKLFSESSTRIPRYKKKDLIIKLDILNTEKTYLQK